LSRRLPDPLPGLVEALGWITFETAS